MASFPLFYHCKSKQLQGRVEQLFRWIFIRNHRVVGNLKASLGQEEPEISASFKSIGCSIRIVRHICAYVQLSSRHVVKTRGNSQGQVLTASLGYCTWAPRGNAGANTLKASCQIVKARWESDPKITSRKFGLAVEPCKKTLFGHLFWIKLCCGDSNVIQHTSPAFLSPPNIISCMYTETLCMLHAHQTRINVLPSHTTW